MLADRGHEVSSPSPRFFVSVDSKGLTAEITPLFSYTFVSVDSTGFNPMRERSFKYYWRVSAEVEVTPPCFFAKSAEATDSARLSLRSCTQERHKSVQGLDSERIIFLRFCAEREESEYGRFAVLLES